MGGIEPPSEDPSEPASTRVALCSGPETIRGERIFVRFHHHPATPNPQAGHADCLSPIQAGLVYSGLGSQSNGRFAAPEVAANHVLGSWCVEGFRRPCLACAQLDPSEIPSKPFHPHNSRI